MSWLTVIWSACVAACVMLAAMHLYLWFNDQKRRFYLWASLACLGAAMTAGGELAMMKATSFDAADQVIFWQVPAIALLIVSLTWFLFTWFGTGRRWLAVGITALWIAAVAHDLFLPGNPLFTEIRALEPHQTLWSETYVVPTGPSNPFKFLGDIASLLFLWFVIDASVRIWRQGNRRRAWSVGGVIVLFILFAGIHTPLVDAGLVKTPYLIGFFFLAIAISLTYELLRDVSRASMVSEELRQVRGELEHVGRVNLLGEISAALAHELNQPLAAILANAQAGSRFLKVENPDLAEIGDILEDIAGENKRAREIIQRLRSMLEKGEVVRKLSDLNHVVEEAVALMGHELERNGVALELDLDSSLPTLTIDRPGVQQVIVNLLLNAERAAASNGNRVRKVHVKSRLDGEAVSVEVSDSGPGIDEESLQRIFDPFFTTESSGLGMGLSICRTIIEDHRGEIRAGNQNNGGAVFTFTLPVESDSSP